MSVTPEKLNHPKSSNKVDADANNTQGSTIERPDNVSSSSKSPTNLEKDTETNKSDVFPGFDSTPLVATDNDRKMNSAEKKLDCGSEFLKEDRKPSLPMGMSKTPPPHRDKLSGLTRCFNPPKLER